SRIEEEFSIFFSTLPPQLLREIGAVPTLTEPVNVMLISHGHFDHYAALFTIPNPPAIYGSKFTMLTIEGAQQWRWHRNYEQPKCQVQTFDKPIEIEHVKVTAISADHTIPGAYCFLIETSNATILYASDYRLYNGHKFYHAVSNRVDALITEGTNIGKPSTRLTEKRSIELTREVISEHKGLITISVSPNNIFRIACMIQMARSLGREVCLTLDILEKLMKASTIYNVPKVNETSLLEVAKAPENFIVLTGQIDNYHVTMFRAEFSRLFTPEGAYVVSHNTMMSPFSQLAYENLKHFLSHRACPLYYIHSSGHSYLPEIQKMIENLHPHLVFPIYTEFPEAFRQFCPTDINVVIPERCKKYYFRKPL
ncbi:MAG: MBL fold metallo-hydrolase, partial [Candidatus Bathyarchaeia archaeon]